MSSDNTGSPGAALSPPRILSLAASCLAKDGPGLQHPCEAIALICHACMIAVDFRLIGLDDEKQTDSLTEMLPADWNRSDTYSFKYAHKQSSMHFMVKIIKLGDRAIINALALGHDKTFTFDLPIRDYISASALPLPASSDLANGLSRVFISSERLNDFITLLRINAIQRLAPGLQKEGYEETGQNLTDAPQRRQEPEPRQPVRDPLRDDRVPPAAQPRPLHDPLFIPPRRPVPAGDFPPPGFEDEYEINVPPRGFHPQGPGGRPFNIGERDLYPPGLGPHDPLRPHFGPMGGGGGMHPTFDDPMFGGEGGQAGQFDPQVPPGARYDPVGPGDGRPFGQGTRPGGGFPGRGGGGFPGFGGGFGGGII